MDIRQTSALDAGERGEPPNDKHHPEDRAALTLESRGCRRREDEATHLLAQLKIIGPEIPLVMKR